MTEPTTIAMNAAPQPKVAYQRRAGRCVVLASGHWVVAHAKSLDAELRSLVRRIGGQDVDILLNDVSTIDTAGAWLAARTVRDLEEDGRRVSLEGNGKAQGLIERALIDAREPIHCTAPQYSTITKIGRAADEVGRESWHLMVFLGEVVVKLVAGLLRPWRIRWRSVISHIEQAGVDAVPIVVLLSALVGLVLAFQGGQELKKFGAELLTVDLLGISILREMGPLLTAIIVAGRSGSAFAAQIGTMKLNEEIDALRTIGLDPIDMLVIPRVLGLILILPLVAFLADLAALAGGAVVVAFVYDISFAQIISQFQQAVTSNIMLFGLMKVPAFAFIIAIIGCRNGMRVSGGASSVGENTTRAVVTSIFLVIAVNALISVIFARFGL